MKKIAAKPKHSSIGASSAKRWLNCPGSVPLIKLAPPSGTSEYAEEGTAAHELAEKALLAGTNAIDFFGMTFNKKFVADEEMCEAVQLYLDTVRAIENPDVFGVETKVHLHWIHDDLYGTSDAHAGYRGEYQDGQGKLWVFDYKHGAGVSVDADENEQLMYYTLGVAHQYDFYFNTYEAVIVQPRAQHDEGPVRRYEFTRERLMAFEQELKDGLHRVYAAEKHAEDPFADMVPHLKCGSWCRFCPAQITCPRMDAEMAIACTEDFDPITDDFHVVGPTPPEQLTPEKIAKALEFANIIESWLSAVRSHAYFMAENGATPPGYKLVARKGHRAWKDEQKVRDIMRMLGFTNEEISAPAKLKSPAQMEKLKQGIDKEFVNSLAAAPDTGFALVPESDKRPAVLLLENQGFSEIEG